ETLPIASFTNTSSTFWTSTSATITGRRLTLPIAVSASLSRAFLSAHFWTRRRAPCLSSHSMKDLKAISLRLFWFVLGGVLSIGVNAGLFQLFAVKFGWNRFVAYGLSLGLVNVLLFFWNYLVGFKTSAHWTVSAR